MPNNEKNAEPAVRDAQSTAARRRRRRHTPHGDAPAQNPAPRAPQPKDASRPCPPRQAAPNNRSNAAVSRVPATIFLKNALTDKFCSFIEAHRRSTDSPFHKLS